MADIRLIKGKKVRPPAGFRKTLRIRGERYKVEYYDNLWNGKQDDDHALDGMHDPEAHVIYVAVEGYDLQSLRRTLLHEIHHVGLKDYMKGHGKYKLSDELEEGIVVHQESALDSALANNKWFVELYHA